MNLEVTPLITTDGFKFYERVIGRVFGPGSVGCRTDGLELSLKLYHVCDLRLGHQQSVTEAPTARGKHSSWLPTLPVFPPDPLASFRQFRNVISAQKHGHVVPATALQSQVNQNATGVGGWPGGIQHRGNC